MRRCISLWPILAALCLLLTVRETQAFSPSIHAHFMASVSPAPVTGQTVTVTVQTTVGAGWHIYSVVPSPGGPFPTDLSDAGPGWQALSPAQEDAPQRLHDPNFGIDVGYHEKTATFQRQFRVTANGPTLPTITIHYQTCNDRECLPPTQMTLPLTVAASAAALSGPGGSQSGDTGLGWFLLGAFGAGLITLLTPCVFPLIPITLTSFVKQADGDRGRLVRLSSGYALGIVALYVGLGILVTALAGAAGLDRLGSNPWVNLLIFALFVLFALSFFEAVTVSLPVNLGALQAAGRKHGGLLGIGLLGIAFVLASFTCIAPFVGTVLVASAGGPSLRPTLGLLAFAVAFALPFFVFALFPQWIARIPRSGPWLSRVKGTLGFVELAAALKFLSNADLYWQWKVLTQPVLLAAWAVLLACAALYLLGLLRIGIVAETEKQRKPISMGRRVAAGVFLAGAVYCLWGLAGRPINLLQTYLPPRGYGSSTTPTPQGLPWLTNYHEALVEARAQNKPLLIDFTGNFCTNCRYNENNVFPTAAVQHELGNFVRVQLYTDGQHDGANQKLQLDKFGDIALPLYGVVDPKTGAAVAKASGVQTATGFTDFLAKSHDPSVASR